MGPAIYAAVGTPASCSAGPKHHALVSGDFDMLVLVRSKDLDTIRDVVLERLTKTPGVQSTTTFVLDEMTPRAVVLPPQ